MKPQSPVIARSACDRSNPLRRAAYVCGDPLDCHATKPRLAMTSLLLSEQLFFRAATPADATQLFDIRREAIVTLAPKGMMAAQTRLWAKKLTLAGMEQKIRELEVWMVGVGHARVSNRQVKTLGWGAIQGDNLEALYIAPEFSGQGIGTKLLDMLEGLLRDRAVPAVRADASLNAEGFYLRRGYEPIGPRCPNGAQPITKRLN